MASNSDSTKRCSRCKCVKTLDAFARASRNRDNRQSWCRTCYSAALKERRAAEDGEAKQLHNARVAAWRAANPEQARQHGRKWRAANLEKARLESRKQYAANAEKRREYARAYRRAHPGYAYKKTREWIKANPEKHREHSRTRRDRKRGAVGNGWTVADVAEIKIGQRGRCAICRERLPKNFHRDHIIPLARDGAHERRNLQLTCGPCNQSKGARDPIEHARSLGRLL